MMRAAVLVFALLSVASYAQDRPASFEGFEFKPPEPGAPTFVFSTGAATSKSPIRMSIPGRGLTNADRVYRTNLQKHWLSQHVPPRFKFPDESRRHEGTEDAWR
jgi:hypothetical protein